jgi:hypothetical protein
VQSGSVSTSPRVLPAAVLATLGGGAQSPGLVRAETLACVLLLGCLACAADAIARLHSGHGPCVMHREQIGGCTLVYRHGAPMLSACSGHPSTSMKAGWAHQEYAVDATCTCTVLCKYSANLLMRMMAAERLLTEPDQVFRNTAQPPGLSEQLSLSQELHPQGPAPARQHAGSAQQPAGRLTARLVSMASWLACSS